MYSAECEILMNFDPLHQSTTTTAMTKTTPTSTETITSSKSYPSVSYRKIQAPASAVNPIVEYTIVNSSPEDSPKDFRDSTFHANDDVNPFLTSPSEEEKWMKHGASDTNLHRLQAEVTFVPTMGDMNPYMTRSEEDLAGTGGGNEAGLSRHCVASPAGSSGVVGASHLSGSMGGRVHRVPEITTDGDREDRLSRSLFFVPLDDASASISSSSSSLCALNDHQHNHSDETERTHTDRQSRSNETSPVAERRNSPSMSRRHRLEFLNPAGIKPMNRINLRSPDLRHIRKGLSKGRDRSKSAAVGVAMTRGKKSQWVSRYRPGVPVPIPGETARESIMQSELRHREKEFCNSIKAR